MKYFIVFIIILTALTTGCNPKTDIQIAQETSIEYIKQHMKNPDSFKVLSIETNIDTIPPYLSDKVLEAYELYKIASEEEENYIPDYFSSVDVKKKIDLLKEKIAKFELCQNYIRESSKLTPDVQYLTCIKYNAENSFGGTLSSYSIVVAAKEKPDSILGSYDLENDEFITRFKSLSIEFYGKEKFKENKYGKIDTTGFSFFEKFIIDAIQ